jgi:flagellar protein FliS
MGLSLSIVWLLSNIDKIEEKRMYGNRAENYKRNEIVTSDPKRLVTMCYSAAIMNFKLAKTRYLEKAYEEKSNALQKALNIVSELMASLNFEKGGQIATNLNALYEYVLRRAAQADLERDMKGFDEVIHILEELSEAWTVSVMRGGKKADENTGVMKTPEMTQPTAYRSTLRA